MSMAVLLLCSVIPALASAGENGAETIVVGVPIDRCPLFYLNPDTKEITGIGVDLMQYAAQEAGFEAEFTAINAYRFPAPGRQSAIRTSRWNTMTKAG